jgi:hypothetical protein
MQHVQFSIIKCSFYAKNEIYRRGYTSYSDNFIHCHVLNTQNRSHTAALLTA